MKQRAIFRFERFSPRQLKILTWWCAESPAHDHDGILADGASRSGKTLSMSLSFVLWAMSTFNMQNFGMCGKTIGSFRRNVLVALKLMLRARGFRVEDRRGDNLLVVRRKDAENYFYVFGGKDERSQDLIQGVTLAGVFFDEVALMPQSFVNQATGRCSVDGSKFWFNCNPEGPDHWFYTEWILKHKEKRILYLHFTMEDNPSLTDRIKERYRAMYDGVFYDRFIRGLWVIAEGLIYRQFAQSPEHWLVDGLSDAQKANLRFISIGVDFGGTRSLTTFVATAVIGNFDEIVVYKDAHIPGVKGEIDAERVATEFIRFCRTIEAELPNGHTKYAFMDSEAQYLINSVRKAARAAGLGVQIGDSAKHEIMQRIVCTLTLLNMNRMHILRRCTLLIGGLKSASWDETKKKDVRLDNFSSDIDILDGFEYSFERFMKKLVPEGRQE